MANKAVATYRAGETFTCTARKFDPRKPGGRTKPCDTTVVMHGFWWCAQVCPKCLTTYNVSSGSDNGVYLGHGYFDHKTAINVRANIVGNGGQYIPTF